MNSRLSIFLIYFVTGISHPVHSHPLDSLEPGHWYEVPASHLLDVSPIPIPPGTGGVHSVVDAWSGGAYDTKRDRLIVWGGGHRDYSGNELYIFDVNTLTWIRLTEPSIDVGGDETSGFYPDGLPRSRHTYDSLEYLPEPIDRFCHFSDAAMYPQGGKKTTNVNCFNFQNLTWESKAPTLTTGAGIFTGFDQTTNFLWMHGAEGGLGSRFVRYDILNDTWTGYGYDPRGSTPPWYSGVVDPIRKKFIGVGWITSGVGEVIMFDLLQPSNPLQVVQTTGDTEIIDQRYVGLEFDPVIRKIVAYSGGEMIYLFNPTTLHWERISPAQTNTVSPGPPSSTGTFGRFRYIPSKNAYIVVHDADTNVFFYKLPLNVGDSPDITAPRIPENLHFEG